jgi:aminoacrylate hydrolase
VRIAEEVLRLADRLDIARVACGGHSTGGLVAQALALDAPDRISALVLSCTWARPDRRFRDLFEVRRVVLQNSGLRAYAMLAQLMGYPAAAYESVPAPPGIAERTGNAAAEVALICERIDMLLSYERADELGAITQPTLIVAAPDDQIVPINHAQDLAQRIPNAQLVELAGGHLVPATHPVDYAVLVERFLRARPPPTAIQDHESRSP